MKINLFIVALFNLIFVQGQTFKIETKELEEKLKAESSVIIGYEDNAFYVASFYSDYKFEVGLNATGQQRKLLIQKFSNDLKLLAQKEILENDGEDLGFPIYFGNSIYVLSTKLNKKTNTWTVSGQKLDNIKLFTSGSPVILYSIKKEMNETLSGSSHVISPDGKYLAFHSFPTPGPGKDYSELITPKIRFQKA